MSKSSLNWKGEELKEKMIRGLSAAVVEIDLRIEGEAKKELQKGHGVMTGTLRRSIHSAAPDYSWSSDNVEPSPSSPDRGSHEFEPAASKLKITGVVGSGMEYAMAVHQGHGSFPGYHFLTIAIEKVKADVLKVISKKLKELK